MEEEEELSAGEYALLQFEANGGDLEACLSICRGLMRTKNQTFFLDVVIQLELLGSNHGE